MDEQLSDILKKLSPERRALLALRLNRKNAAAQSARHSTAADRRLLYARPSAHASQSSLVAIQPMGNKLPFFCVHPAGGHVFCYMELARRLGPEQPFYGFQSRDFDGKEVERRNVEMMAASYVKTLLEHHPAGPYLIGGWSMGGVVAFEMARQLYLQGQEVASLVLFDARIPTDEQKLETEDEVALIFSFASDLGISQSQLGSAWYSIRQLRPDERLAFVLRELKASCIIPDDIELSQIQIFFETFKENARAMCTYTPGLFSGLLTLFVAETVSSGADDMAKSWDEWASGRVEVFRSPGSHSTMMREPHVGVLAEQLKACLKRIE